MHAGARVDERFVIERQVGEGGMGAVYAARDLSTGERVALKVLHGRAEEARFEREAQLLADLDHPGIVRYVAHKTSDRRSGAYLAMEWLEGEDLAVRLERGKLTDRESLVLVRTIAAALGAAHARGIVHRDIKPSNLFLVGGDVSRAKVLDFGIAIETRVTTTRATRAGITFGTPGYMAPEQARGDPDVGPAADVFSLGCVLFECLSGRPAFLGTNAIAILAKILFEEAPRLRDAAPEVSAALDELVGWTLAKSASARPADAGEITRILDTVCDEEETSGIFLRAAIPPGAPPVASLSADEQRFVAVVIVGALSVDPLAATVLLTEEEAVQRRALVDVAHRFEARAEILRDGSLVFVLPSGGAPSDQADRAGSFARALREVARDLAIVIGMGRAETGGALPMGEAIDRAAELLRTPAVDRGAIRVDEVTASMLGDRVERDADGAAILSGERESGTSRTLLGVPTPCVGRDAELHTLRKLIDRAIGEPHARAVIVTGPAGIGKSRVCDELVSHLRRAHGSLDVWMAEGDPMSGGAFALAAQMVRRGSGVHDGEPLAVRRAKLLAWVSRHVRAEEAPRVGDFLGEMIGASFPDTGNVPLSAARSDPRLMGDQMRRAFADLVDAETAAHPLVIVLEDLQWGDPPTVGLVDTVLRLFSARPLVVLAFARPEVHDRFPDVWQARAAHSIALAPLARAAAEALVRVVLGDGIGADRLARIVDRAAGNAFSIEELIRHEALGGGDDAPETVLAMVAARLDALAPAVRRLLRAASVFGQTFWQSGAAALMGGNASVDVATALDDLVRREIVVRRPESRFAFEEELAFRHAIVRDAAYAMLTEADRTLGHRLAADWLERVGEEDAMVLAEHLDQGGEARRATRALLRAAEQALDSNDLDATLARAARGISAGATEDVLGRLRLLESDALYWQGKTRESLGDAEKALRLVARFGPEWCKAAHRISRLSCLVGEVNRSVVIANMLIHERARATNVEAYLVSAFEVATNLLYAGRADVADALFRAAGEAGNAGAYPRSAVALLHAKAAFALQGGETAAYLESKLAVSAILDQMGDARLACSARMDAGFGLLELGAFAEAEKVILQGLATAERLGLVLIGAVARHNLGKVVAALGRASEGERVEREALDTFKAIGDRRFEGLARTYLAAILFDAGKVDEAEVEARAAADLLVIAPPQRPQALALLARIALSRGRTPEALGSAREAMANAETGNVEEGEALIRLVHAEALDAAGYHEEACAALTVARDRLVEREGKIGDIEYRRSFVEDVPENARTFELARAWRIPATSAP